MPSSFIDVPFGQGRTAREKRDEEGQAVLYAGGPASSQTAPDDGGRAVHPQAVCRARPSSGTSSKTCRPSATPGGNAVHKVALGNDENNRSSNDPQLLNPHEVPAFEKQAIRPPRASRRSFRAT